MKETPPPVTMASQEGSKAPESALELYDQLISPDAMSRFEGRVTLESERFDYKTETESILGSETLALSQIQEIIKDEKVGDSEKEAPIQALNEELSRLAARYSEATNFNQFNVMRVKLWETRKTMLFDSREPDIQSLSAALVNNAKTSESPFVPEEDFVHAADKDHPGINIKFTEQPIEVPLTSVVTAIGFKSWENGRPEDNDKAGRNSQAVIQDYALREGNIPSIESARALILTNGEVVFMTENSHRVAAAKLKGQKTIQIKYLEISKAKHDLE